MWLCPERRGTDELLPLRAGGHRLAPVRLVRPDLRLLSQRLGTPFGDGEPEPGAPPFAGHRRELKATLWSVLWLILEHESCHMALCHRVEMLFLAPLK